MLLAWPTGDLVARRAGVMRSLAALTDEELDLAARGSPLLDLVLECNGYLRAHKVAFVAACGRELARRVAP